MSTVLNFYRLTCSASPVYRIYYTAVTGVYCPQFLPPHLLRLTGLPDLLHGCYRCLLSSISTASPAPPHRSTGSTTRLLQVSTVLNFYRLTCSASPVYRIYYTAVTGVLLSSISTASPAPPHRVYRIYYTAVTGVYCPQFLPPHLLRLTGLPDLLHGCYRCSTVLNFYRLTCSASPCLPDLLHGCYRCLLSSISTASPAPPHRSTGSTTRLLHVSTVLNFYRLTCSASPVYRIYYTAVTGVYCPQFLPPHLLRLTGLPDLLHGCYRCLLSSISTASPAPPHRSTGSTTRLLQVSTVLNFYRLTCSASPVYRIYYTAVTGVLLSSISTASPAPPHRVYRIYYTAVTGVYCPQFLPPHLLRLTGLPDLLHGCYRCLLSSISTASPAPPHRSTGSTTQLLQVSLTIWKLLLLPQLKVSTVLNFYRLTCSASPCLPDLLHGCYRCLLSSISTASPAPPHRSTGSTTRLLQVSTVLNFYRLTCSASPVYRIYYTAVTGVYCPQFLPPHLLRLTGLPDLLHGCYRCLLSSISTASPAPPHRSTGSTTRLLQVSTVLNFYRLTCSASPVYRIYYTAVTGVYCPQFLPPHLLRLTGLPDLLHGCYRCLLSSISTASPAPPHRSTGSTTRLLQVFYCPQFLPPHLLRLTVSTGSTTRLLQVSTVLNFYRLTCSASPVYRIYYTAVTGVYCPQFLPPHLLRLTGLPDLLHGCYRCLLSSISTASPAPPHRSTGSTTRLLQVSTVLNFYRLTCSASPVYRIYYTAVTGRTVDTCNSRVVDPVDR